jgi:hypothetical protein
MARLLVSGPHRRAAIRGLDERDLEELGAMRGESLRDDG